LIPNTGPLEKKLNGKDIKVVTSKPSHSCPKAYLSYLKTTFTHHSPSTPHHGKQTIPALSQSMVHPPGVMVWIISTTWSIDPWWGKSHHSAGHWPDTFYYSSRPPFSREIQFFQIAIFGTGIIVHLNIRGVLRDWNDQALEGRVIMIVEYGRFVEI
jgi:hypothetical protein